MGQPQGIAPTCEYCRGNPLWLPLQSLVVALGILLFASCLSVMCWGFFDLKGEYLISHYPLPITSLITPHYQLARF